jgi:DNA-binding transcriptional LysR family regulator
MIKQDISKGKAVTVLDSFLLSDSHRRQVNAVYYKSSAVARRITAFIDFIQPKLKL